MSLNDRTAVIDTISFKIEKQDRIIKNDFVAVLYTPYYGAGWYSYANGNEKVLFDPEIVELVLARDKAENNNKSYYTDKIVEYTLKTYPGAMVSSAEFLHVKWVPVGEKFCVSEHNGYETIEYMREIVWITA